MSKKKYFVSTINSFWKYCTWNIKSYIILTKSTYRVTCLKPSGGCKFNLSGTLTKLIFKVHCLQICNFITYWNKNNYFNWITTKFRKRIDKELASEPSRFIWSELICARLTSNERKEPACMMDRVIQNKLTQVTSNKHEELPCAIDRFKQLDPSTTLTISIYL